MHKFLLAFFAFLFLANTDLSAQTKTKIYTAKFHPQTITYNASPNPNECWEAVAHGIQIKTDSVNDFFSMNYRDVESLKEKIGDAEVEIEVYFYSETDSDSGAVGGVKKIWLKGVVVWEEK